MMVGWGFCCKSLLLVYETHYKVKENHFFLSPGLPTTNQYEKRAQENEF